MAKQELRIISASGILGYGFPEASLARGMERKPDVIGCDAGSTDAGPYYLGSGTAFVSRASCKRDTELLLKAAREAEIPLLLGSAGGAGGEAGLQFLVDIVKEIADENGLHFKLAMIHAEQDKGYLKAKLRQGKITSMGAFPELTEKDIDDAEHIVGVMGVEPYIKALDMGAEVIVAGRSTDTAIFAAVPIRYGFDPGLAWHAGKILECGAFSAEPAVAGDCILVTMRKDHFLVEPMNPKLRHTTLSVAAHALYENPSPYHIYEPGGMLDLTDAKYEQYDERTVKVSGSKFVRAPKYCVKLESAAKVGYRTIAIMGTRDPILIGQIDNYLGTVRNTVREKVLDAFKGKVTDSDYILNFRV
ncbi:MAG: acyclic terpene utilization AtuA family protein, partial [Bacillota bacterium]